MVYATHILKNEEDRIAEDYFQRIVDREIHRRYPQTVAWHFEDVHYPNRMGTLRAIMEDAEGYHTGLYEDTNKYWRRHMPPAFTWGNPIEILNDCPDIRKRLAYINKRIEEGTLPVKKEKYLNDRIGERYWQKEAKDKYPLSEEAIKY